MKRIITLILIFLSVPSIASEDLSLKIIYLFQNEVIRGRDSGEPVTKEFVSNCLKQKRNNHYIIECNDLLFTHYLSIFTNSENHKVLLITQDGASVENRWVFLLKENDFIDIKRSSFPDISNSTISRLLINKTKNDKYTKLFIDSVAHSSYRLIHNPSNIAIVSGVPDDSFGTKLGTLDWVGNKFVFSESK